jgi:hypothetical protein
MPLQVNVDSDADMEGDIVMECGMVRGVGINMGRAPNVDMEHSVTDGVGLVRRIFTGLVL